MAKFVFRTEGLQEAPEFTLSELNDCISAVANAIIECVKLGASIEDACSYVEHWCDAYSMPDEACEHMCAVVTASLRSLGYER